MNKSESKHVNKVALTGCVICREYLGIKVSGDVHHIAQGSEKRSHYMTTCLCPDHHTAPRTGLHGMGVKSFLTTYNINTEYHLMALTNKFISEDS